MHDNHGALGMLERSVVDAVRVLDTLILLLGGETLTLNASAVEDITSGKDLRCQLFRLAQELSGRNQLLTDLAGK